MNELQLLSQTTLSELRAWAEDPRTHDDLLGPLGQLLLLCALSLFFRWLILSPLSKRLSRHWPSWGEALKRRHILHNLAALAPLIGLYMVWGDLGLPIPYRRAVLVAAEYILTLSLARLPWIYTELTPPERLEESPLKGSRDDLLAFSIWIVGAVFMLGTVLEAEVFLAYSTGFLKITLALGLAAAAYWIARYILRQPLAELIRTTNSKWDDMIFDRGVFAALLWVVPLVALYLGAGLFGPAAEGVERLVRTAIIIVLILALTRLLRAAYDIYSRSARAKDLPIKGYIELASLVIWVLGGLIAFGTVLNQSPWTLLSGVGAMTAVLMLIFRDTILSFVASLQIAGNHMIRVGDWISFPKYNADGDVIDIALHVVKVQNWDKTITTIPTHRFISDSFQNWRGMSESGGRRIKRALYLDMTTVRFLAEEDIQKLSKISLLTDYLKAKKADLEEHNRDTPGARDNPLNRRQLTNLGTFRAYALAYIRALPQANPDMTLIVRQLAPGAEGIGIELYLFSKDQRWAYYEDLQADIFDHLIAALGQFDLSVFQVPSGRDMRAFAAHAQGAGPRA